MASLTANMTMAPPESALAFTLRMTALGVGVALAALTISILVYAFGSFWFARGYAPPRTWRVSAKELARELFWSGVTQPFLPLFYFIGVHMGGKRRSGVPVVFVHGYMQNRVCFVYLARWFHRHGLGPLYGFNYPWYAAFPANAARLAAFIERVCAKRNVPAVDLVCHSAGGLVAMEMLAADEAAAKRVRRCVTIASPHAGVAWRGPTLDIAGASMKRGSKFLVARAGHKLAIPCLSIFSTHDNMVHPKETSMLVGRGGSDFEVEGLAHLAILFSPIVAAESAAFLRSNDAATVEVKGR